MENVDGKYVILYFFKWL